jgi:hypothetical protein
MNRCLALVLMVASCGGVDPEVAQDRVKKIAEASVGSTVRSVTCPRAKNEKGSTFECQVEFEEGGAAAMRIVITDKYGNFEPSWAKAIVSRKNLGPAIGEHIGESVDCGAGVIEAPAALACRRGQGGELAVAVDASGNVTW